MGQGYMEQHDEKRKSGKKSKGKPKKNKSTLKLEIILLLIRNPNIRSFDSNITTSEILSCPSFGIDKDGFRL